MAWRDHFLRRRPPGCVALVARTHWLVGGTIVFFVGLLHALTRHWPVEFGVKAYAITLGLAALYLTAGTLVWLGAPLGRPLSRIAGLLYLARPNLGSHLWRLMSSEEYRAHFTRTRER
ncbi:MAG TPA: hypothetical protein VHD62_09955 [Opitutaceae bacterium]|nr:hypothetical protein [Opitutaceae bacterium]